MNELLLFKDNQDFVTFGTEHLIIILFFISFGFLLINWAKKLPIERKFKVGYLFAWSISISLIIWTVLKISLKGFDLQEDVPLHLCNILALLLPLLTYKRNRTVHLIIFFWILAGTTHALITPSVESSIPHFGAFKYWYVHAGLVIFALYSAIVYKFYPTFKSVLVAFVAMQIYIVIMYAINWVLGTNYFYTNGKPKVATALNYLGDYPTYVFVVIALMIPYFTVFYLPFYFSKKRSERKSIQS